MPFLRQDEAATICSNHYAVISYGEQMLLTADKKISVFIYEVCRETVPADRFFLRLKLHVDSLQLTEENEYVAQLFIIHPFILMLASVTSVCYHFSTNRKRVLESFQVKSLSNLGSRSRTQGV